MTVHPTPQSRPTARRWRTRLVTISVALAVLEVIGGATQASAKPLDDSQVVTRQQADEINRRYAEMSSVWDSIMASKAEEDEVKEWCDSTSSERFTTDTVGLWAKKIGILSYSVSYVCWFNDLSAYHTNNAIEEWRPQYEKALADLRWLDCRPGV